MILVAPAIFAPLTIKKGVKGSQSGEDNQTKEDSPNSINLGNPFIQLFRMLSKFAKFISQAIMRVVKGMVGMFSSLYKKFLSAVLRSAFAVMLVRNFSFDSISHYIQFDFSRYCQIDQVFQPTKEKYQMAKTMLKTSCSNILSPV